MRSIILIIALAVFLTVSLTSCFDPEPGEIIPRCKLNGRERSCVVMIFGSSGKQINEVPTDSYGVAYIKSLVPDTYVLKFKDIAGTMYPAEVTVDLDPGASQPVDIELSTETGQAE